MDDLAAELGALADPVSLMNRVAEQACSLIPHADGAAVSLCDAHGRLVVFAAHGLLESARGRVTTADDTFSVTALRSLRPVVSSDLTSDPRIRPEIRNFGESLGAHSLLTIPLLHEDTATGVLSLIAYAVDAFDDDTVARITALSGVISTMIEANTALVEVLRNAAAERGRDRRTGSSARFLASVVDPDLATRDRQRADLDSLRSPEQIQAVFQPVVDLGERTIRAFEGLSRFPHLHPVTPHDWFAIAQQVGRGTELELLALDTVLTAARGLPDDYLIGVNLSPRTALDARAQQLLLTSRRRLVLELTEHEPAPQRLHEGLNPLRRNGILIAVDDVGSGFAGLTQILRLRPDIIKLDREISAGIESDPIRRALITALMHVADEMGATIVAEGIESGEQCTVLRDLGVRYGQGYWLGRPRPVGAGRR